ncbi:hypothetical protein QBC34DRAFT_432715 [Podospora aff. communis PSN243]|uniref:Tat pathway signal sequence n=1 Tax=Podospora aff. communis PSN243 TaxID=3040156 RepID=A0AAV9H444_9PEZI|nr:hypothetical protein QBC34DRAFT_432715 [Podospora aff. communis PSN243]
MSSFFTKHITFARHVYKPLEVQDGDSDDASKDSSECSASLPLHSGHENPPKESHQRPSNASLTLLAFSLIVLFISSSSFIQARNNRVTDDRCLRRMSAPSPALEAIRFEWTSLHEEFQPDVYSGYPSLASEQAWAKLWDFGAFNVPLNLLAGLNKSSVDGDFRLVGEENGGGVGGLLEGAHQIHCLNLVRQYIYREHWDYSDLPSFNGGPKVRRHHVDHCVSTLRMVLTCLSDVTPIVFERRGGRIAAVEAPRKCRVYSGLLDWVNQHSVFDSAE